MHGLLDEVRAQQVLVPTLDASDDHLAGNAARCDGGGHEHAGVEDDQHYDEVLRRSVRAAASSS